MKRLLISAALVAGSCGTDTPPTAAPMLPPPVEEGSADPVEIPAEPTPPTLPPEPTAPPPPEPVAATTTIGQDRLDLAPAWAAGQTLRREVHWASESQITVSHDGRDVNSSIVGAVDAIIQITVTSADKGAAQAIELRFESVAREAAGAPWTLDTDPAPGDVWSCRVDADPVICATSPEVTRAPPEWLAFGFDALLPARPVAPGENWSRRLGVGRTVALGEDGIARATVRAEAPYQTASGHYSTCQFDFEGEDLTRAFGRTARLALTGEGAFEFDLQRRRVTTFDASWTGRATGQRTDGTAYTRESETTVRVSELPD